MKQLVGSINIIGIEINIISSIPIVSNTSSPAEDLPLLWLFC
jgi:hypothetical protein